MPDRVDDFYPVPPECWARVVDIIDGPPPDAGEVYNISLSSRAEHAAPFTTCGEPVPKSTP